MFQGLTSVFISGRYFIDSDIWLLIWVGLKLHSKGNFKYFCLINVIKDVNFVIMLPFLGPVFLGQLLDDIMIISRFLTRQELGCVLCYSGFSSYRQLLYAFLHTYVYLSCCGSFPDIMFIPLDNLTYKPNQEVCRGVWKENMIQAKIAAEVKGRACKEHIKFVSQLC